MTNKSSGIGDFLQDKIKFNEITIKHRLVFPFKFDLKTSEDKIFNQFLF